MILWEFYIQMDNKPDTVGWIRAQSTCSCQSLIPMRLLICMHGSAVGTRWAGVRWVGWSVGCCRVLPRALTVPPRIILATLFPSLSLISLIKCESLRLFVSLSL